jgi:hypothetical protein
MQFCREIILGTPSIGWLSAGCPQDSISTHVNSHHRTEVSMHSQASPQQVCEIGIKQPASFTERLRADWEIHGSTQFG